MPVNQILAPAYSRMKYTPTHTNRQHITTLYFDAVPVYDEDDGLWRFGTYTDADHLTGYTLREIWDEVVLRTNGILVSINALPEFVVNEVEVWSGVEGLNMFLGLDPDDYSGVSGAGTGVAAASLITTWKAANREQFKEYWADTGTANPQRVPIASPPTLDNDGLAWFMLKSPVNFVTQDNERLVLAGNANTGYNEKLKKSYGRTVSP